MPQKSACAWILKKASLSPFQQHEGRQSDAIAAAQDEVWEASHKQLAEVNGQLAKACIQNPLEYRATALAAIEFASRPHDLGVDAQQAVHFCTQMMG